MPHFLEVSVVLREYLQKKEASVKEALLQLGAHKAFLSSVGGAEYELLATEHLQNSRIIEDKKAYLEKILNKQS